MILYRLEYTSLRPFQQCQSLHHLLCRGEANISAPYCARLRATRTVRINRVWVELMHITRYSHVVANTFHTLPHMSAPLSN